MSIPETLLSELNLGDLTESEQDAIVEVLKRDMELRHQEAERIQNLRDEVNQLHTMSAQWQSRDNREKLCPLCHTQFGWLFDRGDNCPQCDAKVCDKCRQPVPTKEKWVCVLCLKQMDLKARSGSWFYSKFPLNKRQLMMNPSSLKQKNISDAFTRSTIFVDGKNGNTDVSTGEGKDRVLQWPYSLKSKTRSVESVIFPEEKDKRLLAELLVTKNISISSNNLNNISEKDLMIYKQNILNERDSEITSDSLDSPDRPDLNLSSEVSKQKPPFRIILPDLKSDKETEIERDLPSGTIGGKSRLPESEHRTVQAERPAVKRPTESEEKEQFVQMVKNATDPKSRRTGFSKVSIRSKDSDDDDDDDDSLSIISEKTEVDYSEPQFHNRNRSNYEPGLANQKSNQIAMKSFPASVSNQQDLDLLINELARKENLKSVEKRFGKFDSFDTIAEHNQKVLIGSDSVSSDDDSDSETRQKISKTQVNSNSKSEDQNTHHRDLNGVSRLSEKTTSTTRLQNESSDLNKNMKSDKPRTNKPADNLSFNHSVSSEVNSNQFNQIPAASLVGDKVEEDGKEQKTSNRPQSSREYFSNGNQKESNKNEKTKSKSQIEKKTRSGNLEKAVYLKRVAEMGDSLSVLVNEEVENEDLEEDINTSAAYNQKFVSELESDINLSEICEKQDNKLTSGVLSGSSGAEVPHTGGKIDLQSIKKRLRIGEYYSEPFGVDAASCTSPTKKIVLNEILIPKNANISGKDEVDMSSQMRKDIHSSTSVDSDADEMQEDAVKVNQEHLLQKSNYSSPKEISGSTAVAFGLTTKGQSRKLQRDDAFEEDLASVDASMRRNSKTAGGKSPRNSNSSPSQQSGSNVKKSLVGVGLLFSANKAVEGAAVEFEELSEDDEISRSGDVARAKISVVGAALSATDVTPEIFTAPEIAVKTEFEADLRQKRPSGESVASEEEISKYFAVPLVSVDSELLKEETDDFEEISESQNEFDPDRLSCRGQFNSNTSTLHSAVSQESIVSMYSNPGLRNLGRISVTGEIELGVRYNDRLSCIEVSVRRCRNLAVADTKKKRTDPYVKTYLLPDKSRSSKRKTVIKKNTVNPNYNEVIRYVVPRSELDRRTVWVSVWHYDRFGRNDCLGDVVLPLNDQTLNETEPQWYRLEQEAGMKWKSVLSLVSKADLDVALKYVTVDRLSKIKGKQKRPHGELIVTVKMARNLSAVLGNSQCDAFCKCRLLPEQSHYGKHKTRVVKQSLNPVWNHTFVFSSVALDDLANSSLELTVWDYDRFKSSEFLGGLRLNLGSHANNSPGNECLDANEEEFAVWRNMLDRPNEWAEASLQMRTYME